VEPGQQQPGLIIGYLMKTLATFLIGLSFLANCDCLRMVKGTVVDKSTGQPINGAKVYISQQDKYYSTTDSSGHYMIRFIENGLQCYCTTKKEFSIEKGNYNSAKFVGGQQKTELEPLPNLKFNDTNCIPLPDILDGQPVFKVTEKNAEFPGGQKEFMIYLMKNLQYPKEQASWQGSIYLTFIVDNSGKIRNECIFKRYFNGELSPIEKEALRIIREMPTWIPAEQNGKKVYTRVTLPIKL